MKTGFVHVLTGDGPGKTTSAIGIALRSMGHGYKVYMIMFVKGKSDYGEVLISKKLLNFTLVFSGRETFVDRRKPKKIDLELAKKNFAQARDVVMGGQYDVVILDEINVAIDFGLLKLDEVIELIKNKPKGVELILTGRHAPRKLYDYADYVTETREIKHPYSRGIVAREGIEY